MCVLFAGAGVTSLESFIVGENHLQVTDLVLRIKIFDFGFGSTGEWSLVSE
jgi:hypothetical protein